MASRNCKMKELVSATVHASLAPKESPSLWSHARPGFGSASTCWSDSRWDGAQLRQGSDGYEPEAPARAWRMPAECTRWRFGLVAPPVHEVCATQARSAPVKPTDLMLLG